MKSPKFDKLCKRIVENVTTTSAGVGSTNTSTDSGDFYAPGDSRTPTVLGIGKKKKGAKIPLITRRFPTGL